MADTPALGQLGNGDNNHLGSVARLTKRSDVAFAIFLVSIMAVLVLPVPTAFLSVLLAANLGLAMMVLLVAIYTKEPLEFSTFPSLLLVTTLFRLGPQRCHHAADLAQCRWWRDY